MGAANVTDDVVSWPDAAHDDLLPARGPNFAREQNPAVGVDSNAKRSGGCRATGHLEVDGRKPACSKARIRAAIWIEADHGGQDAHSTDKYEPVLVVDRDGVR